MGSVYMLSEIDFVGVNDRVNDFGIIYILLCVVYWLLYNCFMIYEVD